jgi:hypothetical protein
MDDEQSIHVYSAPSGYSCVLSLNQFAKWQKWKKTTIDGADEVSFETE